MSRMHAFIEASRDGGDGGLTSVYQGPCTFGDNCAYATSNTLYSSTGRPVGTITMYG